MKRINFALTARIEEKILNYMVTRIPSWITPDILTLGALIAALVGGIFYVLSDVHPVFLLGVNVCLLFHWLGDSLDGRIARYRNAQRPNYGYYVDHILDSVSAVFFLGGLTTSTLTETTAWVWVLSLMLLSMVHVFLKTKAMGIFELSLQSVGPTEARLGLALINFIILLFGNPYFVFWDIPLRLLDVIGWAVVLLFVSILVPEILKTAHLLHMKDAKHR